MTPDLDAAQLVELALGNGFISLSQAEQLKNEINMFPVPSATLLSQMLRRGVLTPEQGKSLVDEAEASKKADANSWESAGAGSKASDDQQSSSPTSSSELSHPYDIDIDVPLPAQTAPTHPASRLGGSPPRSSMPAYELPGALRPGPNLSPASPTQPSPAQPRRSIADAIGLSRQAMQASPAPTAPVEPARPTQQVPASPPAAAFKPQVISPALPSASQGLHADPQLRELFKLGRERGCSDLHLTVGKPPYMRHEGRLLFLPEPPLTPGTVEKLINSVLTPEQQQLLKEHRQLDFSFEAAGLGRYRSNVYHQRRGPEAAFRFIPQVVPTLESLNLPSVLEKLTTYPQGLNLVTGPGGCGKTTTVAAMLQLINAHRREHIITVEDPVEYVFHPQNCQITQREVGTHTNSFAHALRTALRQDPDVIMIGELRDLETTSIAITAAETGHLVFSTLHTSSAVRTVARILDVYPPAQRPQICMMVAESLRGIISQQLLPRKDGKGRVCAMEVLVVTTGVSQVIKEGKTHQLVSHMQSGRKLGMKSMDDALMDLLQSGAISGSTAWAHAENKTPFDATRTQS